MKTRIFLAVFLSCSIMVCSCSSKPNSSRVYPKTGSVERLVPRIDEIIKPGVVPEIIADSFIWSEGPLWIPGLEMLLFSDIPQNSVFQWTEKDSLNVYLKPSGYTGTIQRGGETGSNGLLLNHEGRLVLCQHGDRRMARMNAPLDKPEPEFTTLAGKWEGNRFNSPNDAAYDARGELYFTDPAYGLEQGWNDPEREMDFAGVFRLSRGGEVSLLIDDPGTQRYRNFSGSNPPLYRFFRQRRCMV